MKLRSLVVGMLFAGLLSIPAFAQTAGEGPARGGRARAGRGAPGEGLRSTAAVVDQQMERLNKELNLSKEQQDKIRKLLTDHQDQMREQMRKNYTENRDKMRELRTQMQEAQKAGDKEKVKTLEGQMRDLMGESKREAAQKKVTSDIEATLTAEQKPKFDKIKGQLFGMRFSLEERPELLLRAVEPLNLPKEKMDKIRSILDDYQTKVREARQAKTYDEKAAKANAAEAYKKVMNELTPEQQAKVKEWRPGPMMFGRGGEGATGRGQGGGRRRAAGGGGAGTAEPK
jgi:Spy/CpxP family protein refolding chaperone